ncbi:MAG TPA: sigma-54-dependent Fis family transcriptional regulator, partial [Gammaproteobacteria bacterium]|nr:sigma-54-dependent Fis family transcriptional regulator [Gammaproteobacteria bacterium]
MANRLLGQSPELTHVLRTLPIIALSDASVLIQGETGVGKELVAKALHQESHRQQKELVIINCAALPESDIEADLFGRAESDGSIIQAGRLLAAQGGTIFFDNVECLPLAVQAKVLRFLEAGECQLLGCHKLQRIDVRVIASTSSDLQKQVNEQHFRQDLYYRLQVVP